MPVDHEWLRDALKRFEREVRAKAAALHDCDPVTCGLCREIVLGEDVEGVFIAERTIEGRVLWALGELWCPGCARLALGLEAVRHVSLPKGKG